jgi:hypothetical protein
MPQESPRLGPKDDYSRRFEVPSTLKADSVGDFKLNDGIIMRELAGGAICAQIEA